MTQTEIIQFFEWAEENLSQFTVTECDESMHAYFNDTFIGGWAGDSRQYFIKHSDELAKLLRMFDAYNGRPHAGEYHAY